MPEKCCATCKHYAYRGKDYYGVSDGRGAFTGWIGGRDRYICDHQDAPHTAEIYAPEHSGTDCVLYDAK